MYTLEKAKPAEADACVALLSDCRDFQRAQGFVQWKDGFPEKSLILSDIDRGKAYVAKYNGEILAYMYLGFDGEPAYEALEGTWHHPGPYTVIHRMGISPAYRGKGLSGVIFSLVEELCISQGVHVLRIDTHFPNKRMQHVLQKHGFRYTGTVRYGPDSRMAYDKKF